MLVVLHATGFNPKVTNGENLGKCYKSYYGKYKSTMLVKNQSRGGLTIAEVHPRLTFEANLEKMCPHFQRMHGIYGERENMNPPMFGAVGLPSHSECYYEENDEDYNDKDEEGYKNEGDEETCVENINSQTKGRKFCLIPSQSLLSLFAKFF